MFTRPTSIALACAGIFATIASSHAQNNSEFNPVVVSASRFTQETIEIPALVNVISKQEIKDSGVTSVADALQKIGNLNVRNFNGGQLGIGATVDMRGFGASARDNTLILVDGQRISPIDSGSAIWESIPLNSIERIEILNGSGSVQYGDKAVGGVINIITRTDKVLPASVSASIGSFGTSLSSGNYSTKFDNTKFDLNFSSAKSNGFRENSQASQGVVKTGFTHFINKVDKVFFEGLFSSQSFGTPGGVLGQVGEGNPRAVKFNNVGDKYVNNGTAITFGSVVSLGQQDFFEGEFIYRDSGATQYTPNLSDKVTNFDKWSLELTPRYKKIWGDLGESVLGFDYSQAMGSFITDLRNNQKSNLVNRAYYITHRLPITNQLDLHGGYRKQSQEATAFDFKNSTGVSNTNKTQEASASDLAFNYRFGTSKQQKVFAKINNSYRFANIDEYWGMIYGSAPPYAATRVFSGILAPQKNNTVEIGGEWFVNTNKKLGLSVYQIDSSNEIRYDHFSGTNINSADIRRVGVIANAQLQMTQYLAVMPKLNIQSAKYKAGPFNGSDVGLVPNITSALGIVYKPKSNTTYISYINYVGSQRYEGDEANTLNKMPSFTTIDLSAIYRQGSWESSINLKNIFDKRYSNYGGYGFVLKPNAPAGNSYFYYPADPRAIFLTTRYTFK